MTPTGKPRAVRPAASWSIGLRGQWDRISATPIWTNAVRKLVAIAPLVAALILVHAADAQPDGSATSSSSNPSGRHKESPLLGPPKDRPKAATSPIRAISWTDRTYDFGGGTTYNFSKNYYVDRDDEGDCNDCMHIRGVTFGDIDRDGQEEALVVVGTNLGGASTILSGYIYGLDNGSPVLRATVEGGDRGEGGIDSMMVKDGDVIVRRFAVSASGSTGGACCPNRIEIERWHWDGGKLVKIGASRIVRRAPKPWYSSRQDAREHGGTRL